MDDPAGAQRNVDDPFTAECMALGRASAAAGLRLDQKAPETYRAAFSAYQGTISKLGYYDNKVLSLRLSAVRRGMLVDPVVNADFLEHITDGRCPVTLERFKLGGGPSPRNPSVDRLVNEVSYRAGNICVVSQRANRAKAELSFEDVLDLAQAQEHRAGLSPTEWLRLASLMYGAWARAYKKADPYLLPLAAIPGPRMFTSTSQVVQLLLTRHFGPGGQHVAGTALWSGLTARAGCDERRFIELRDALAEALAAHRYAGDAWLPGPAFQAFVEWFEACRHVVVPEIEALLGTHQAHHGDPTALTALQPASRYQY